MTWWRAGDREVDVVLSSPSGTVALEMASGERKRGLPGLETFGRTYVSSRKLLIGAQGLPLEIALSS